MSREYAKVTHRFWTGETGKLLRSLGMEAQIVALYMLTCRHSEAIGLYHLPFDYLTLDTGLSREGALKGLQRASEGAFAYYDTVTETAWIPEMARFQLGESLSIKDNKVKWAQKSADSCHSSPYYSAFMEKYAHLYHLTPKPLASPLQAPTKGLRSPLYPSPSPSLSADLSDAGARPTPTDTRFDAMQGPKLIESTFSRLRAEAWLARGGKPGGRYQRATRDYDPMHRAVAFFAAEADPMAALEDSIRGFLADTWATGADWPFATWANDPGKYQGKHGQAPKGPSALDALRAEERDAAKAFRAIDDIRDKERADRREKHDEEHEARRVALASARARLRTAEAQQ